MLDEPAFGESLETASRICGNTGFWPALDDPRLRVGEFAVWEAWDGFDQLDGLIEAQRSGEPALRVVVGATLWFLQFRELESERRLLAKEAFDRFLVTKPVNRSTRQRRCAGSSMLPASVACCLASWKSEDVQTI